MFSNDRYGWSAIGYASILVLIAVTAASIGLLRLSIDNRLERWVDPQGASAQRYDSFKSTFGNDEFALVAYGGQDVFDELNLDIQLDVLEAMEALSSVAHVISIPSVYRDSFGAEEPDELKRDFLDSPFYQRFLVSESGDMAAYFILVDPTDDPDARTKLAQELRKVAEPLRERGFDVFHAGSPVLNAAMDETSLREARVTFPLAFAISVIVLALLLRSLRGAAIAIVCSTLTTVAALGMVGHVGIPLNMMTSVLPALLWVLTLANPIHIIRRFQRESATIVDRREALAKTLRATGLPCALSSLTTAAGFLSLTAATLSPVRQFGIIAALGFTLSLVVSFTLVPQLLLLAGASRRPSRSLGLADRTIRIVQYLHRYPKLIVAVAAAVAILACVCIPSVDLDSSPLTFFDDDTEIVKAYKEIGDQLTGLYSLEVVIGTPSGWLDMAAWLEFERIQRALSESPDVTRVLSPTDVLKKAHQWEHDFAPDAYALPSSTDAATALIEEFGPSENDYLNQQVAGDGTTVRLTVLGHTMTNSGLNRILEDAQRHITTLPRSFDAYATGLVPHIVQSHENLVRTQIRTIAIAFFVVFICIFAGVRSVRLTLLSIPPNVIPILAALSTMAVVGIRLDVATVMTASVALGIAVDDTVHMLTAYQRERGGGEAPTVAWQTTLSTVGPAILVTTLTACAAFATLSLCGFVPLRHFGQLASLAIVVAFVADVLFLPALALALTFRSADSI